MDQVDYVLFVTTTSKPSQKAIQLKEKTGLTVKLLDITQLPMVPIWLSGVPSLLDIKQNILYEGSNCLMLLKTKTEPEITEIEVKKKDNA
jgi:hypothetical protein